MLATLAHTVCQVVTLIPQWLSRNAYVPLVLVMLLASAVCMLFWPLVCVAIAIGRAAAGIGRWLHREGYIGTVVITVLAVALWLSAMTVLS